MTFTKEYVIEITLEPAPILIESNHSIIKGSSDLASLSKRARNKRRRRNDG
ncbi:MAG: hypothetical protein IPI22_13265 [Bacteroidetes bacterium]|nr:hypothetical protein [Bacteroidota bacterium]